VGRGMQAPVPAPCVPGAKRDPPSMLSRVQAAHYGRPERGCTQEDVMPYMRLTLTEPRPDLRAEVERHYRELVKYVRTLPGCLGSYVLVGQDAAGEIGRLSIWEDATAANKAANDPHSMALHAELNFDLQGTLWDRSFDARE